MNLASDLNGDQPPAEYFVESVQDYERALAARSRYEPCRNPWFVRIFLLLANVFQYMRCDM